MTAHPSLSREEQRAIRLVKRKVKAGRPGRPDNRPRSSFDWENVTKASSRSAFRRYEKRRPRDREWPQ
jgi:hypothetical protein